ncbi:MAG TPA: cyclic-di-AMP receptor [Anaerolineae bacterium]|mgnify:CR=1 FL=1|nr:cyclic-di-AMP receptor [Anaerolineae bacterium]HQK13649.1 cyclic-di-AMP receptor [Anaerolineae bacterium]
MKLVIAIVKDSDAMDVSDALVENNFRVTRVASTGGFLRRGRVTLLIGVNEDDIDKVFALIEKTCHAPEHPGEHKATIFVIPAEDFVQLG